MDIFLEYPILNIFLKNNFFSKSLVFRVLFLINFFSSNSCQIPILFCDKYFHGNFSPGSFFLFGAISEWPKIFCGSL